jgi:hypothetical protein
MGLLLRLGLSCPGSPASTTNTPRSGFLNHTNGAVGPTTCACPRVRCYQDVARWKLWLGVQPIVDIFAHHVSGKTVALLDLAFELVALAVDLGEIVIGELAPLLFDFPFGLLLVSFNAIPVHF